MLKGKQQDMITRGIVGLEHPNVNPLFPFAPSDSTIRQHKGIV